MKALAADKALAGVIHHHSLSRLGSSIETIAANLVGLHNTSPVSPYLSVRARHPGFRRVDLDALMWEHPPGRFLPHARKQQTGSAPVIIGSMAELADDAGKVIINLTRRAVPQPERFHRLLEFVPANDAERKPSRDKFRTYRARGLKPESHTINHH